MKKLMTIGLAAALMFAMAGKVSATPLETSGEFRARYWYLNNYFESGKSSEFWDSRLRLNMVWPVAEGVKVSVRADILEGFWGDQLITSTTTPATSTSPQVTAFNITSNTRPQISFDQVNLQFDWPGTPVTITVGRQGTTWGTGMAISADNRDRFKVTGKVGPATLFYTYDKYAEGVNLHDTAGLDDKDQHSIGAVATLAGWKTGIVYALIANGATEHSDWVLNLLDVYGMGQVGPVALKAELSVGFGQDDHDNAPDVDLSTVLAYVGATMPVGPVTLGLEGVYASGDDPNTTDKNEGTLKTDYQSPFWSVVLLNNMDYNGYMGESFLGSDTSLGNAIGVKVSGSIAPMPGLSLYGALVYASRLEDVRTATGIKSADPLGTEIDLVASYAVTPNVNWIVGGGYLVAGDFYGNVDDPWGLMSAFVVKF